MKLMKKIISLCLALLMVATALLPLSSCASSKPPELEDVYDRLVYLIENSHEINVVMFGAGLPVYPRNTEEDALLHRYYGFYEDGREFVTGYSKFKSVEEIKAAASEIYSEDYCSSVFESLFTGYASDLVEGSVLPARYSEDDTRMYQNSHVDPLVTGTRVYDYATMKIVSPSRGDFLVVEINSYAENRPDQWVTIDLSFVFENDNWYLDSPSC